MSVVESIVEIQDGSSLELGKTKENDCTGSECGSTMSAFSSPHDSHRKYMSMYSVKSDDEGEKVATPGRTPFNLFETHFRLQFFAWEMRFQISTQRLPTAR